MYTKEDLYPLIKKIFEEIPHPNVKDDFDMIWDVHEKYMPFNEKNYNPEPRLEIVKTVELQYITNKSKLLEKLADVPDDATITFEADYDGDYVNEAIMTVQVKETITLEKIAYYLFNILHSWACTSGYALYKKLYMLEKENSELKQKLETDGDVIYIAEPEVYQKEYKIQ